jgi:hypothetical protein
MPDHRGNPPSPGGGRRPVAMKVKRDMLLEKRCVVRSLPQERRSATDNRPRRCRICRRFMLRTRLRPLESARTTWPGRPILTAWERVTRFSDTGDRCSGETPKGAAIQLAGLSPVDRRLGKVTRLSTGIGHLSRTATTRPLVCYVDVAQVG